MAIKNVTTLGFLGPVGFVVTLGFGGFGSASTARPCEGPRRRPDESMSYRSRVGTDESLRRRMSSDDDRRTRPPECGNES